MTVDQENPTRLQYSTKFGENGSQYAIVEATNAKDLAEGATDLMDIAELLNRVGEALQLPARKALLEAGVTTTPAQPAPSQQQRYNPNPSQGSVCAHGVPRRVKTGTSSKGPWRAEFCDVKNDPNMPKCEPIWHNG